MKKRIFIICLLAFISIGCMSHYNLSSEEKNLVYKAVKTAVPSVKSVNISAKKNSSDQIYLIITAHLLNDCLPSSTNPIVRGRYGNHQSLTELTKSRCADIMRNILHKNFSFDLTQIKIYVNHGVRVTTVTQGYGYITSSNTRDVAMTLMVIRLKIDSISKTNIQVSEIQNNWKMESNIIPNLQFQAVY